MMNQNFKILFSRGFKPVTKKHVTKYCLISKIYIGSVNLHKPIFIKDYFIRVLAFNSYVDIYLDRRSFQVFLLHLHCRISSWTY